MSTGRRNRNLVKLALSGIAERRCEFRPEHVHAREDLNTGITVVRLGDLSDGLREYPPDGSKPLSVDVCTSSRYCIMHISTWIHLFGDSQIQSFGEMARFTYLGCPNHDRKNYRKLKEQSIYGYRRPIKLYIKCTKRSPTPGSRDMVAESIDTQAYILISGSYPFRGKNQIILGRDVFSKIGYGFFVNRRYNQAQASPQQDSYHFFFGQIDREGTYERIASCADYIHELVNRK